MPPLDPPVDAIVSVSVAASVVKLMLLPAATVKVSVGPSATMLDCPDTANVLNASVTVPLPPPPIAPQAGVEPK